MAGEYDTVVRGGLIADGTGSEPFKGDVAIKEGLIAAVGQVQGSGREEIDARDKLVTPGFVDIHTDYDGQAIWRRPEICAKLLVEAPGPSASMLARVGRTFEYMFPVNETPDYEPPPEASIAAQSRRRNVSPEAIAYDLLLEKNGEAMLFVWLGNYQNGSLDSVYEMLNHDNVVIGLGDGGAHYGMICDASYPTHVLAYGTRDRGRGERMPIAAAIKSLAANPAKAVGLLDRGIIAPGYKADLNIIDYERLTLCSPEVMYDLPAGGRRLNQRAEGFDLTMVSGKVTYRNGQPTDALPGRLVRGAQPVPN